MTSTPRLGQAFDDLNKVFRFVIDRAVCAEPDCGLAFFRRAGGGDDLGAFSFGQLNGHNADAARAAVHQQPLSAFEFTAFKDVVPDGEGRFWYGGCFRQCDVGRDLQAGACFGQAVFGIAAAVYECHDGVAGFPLADPFANGCDLAGDFQARQFRMAFGCRIQAFALQYVWPVNASGSDLDQHLSCPGLINRDRLPLQNLRSAFAFDDDCVHG